MSNLKELQTASEGMGNRTWKSLHVDSVAFLFWKYWLLKHDNCFVDCILNSPSGLLPLLQIKKIWSYDSKTPKRNKQQQIKANQPTKAFQ